MLGKDEDIFENMKSDYNNIMIPDNIDDYVDAGILKGKKVKKQDFVRKISLSAASIFLILTVLSIRISPAFASYVGSLPGFKNIVKLINYDKGLITAVENDFIQHIGISNEQEKIVFTVDYIIADDDRMIIFYTLKNIGDHRFVSIDDFTLMDAKDRKIPAFISINDLGDKDMKIDSEIKDKIHLSFEDGYNIPDTVKIKIRLKEANVGYDEYHQSTGKSDNDERYQKLSSIWEVEIPIDRSRFDGKKQIYKLNQDIEVEGQKIRFTSVTISPTRIAVNVEYDKDNTKRILYFDDLKIVDEKGKEWASIVNDAGASLIDDLHHTIYLQSSYFGESKSLYLKGSSIRAIDKDKLNVKVDIEKGQILTSPDESIVLDSIIGSKDEYLLKFLLKKNNNLNRDYNYFTFDFEFNDSNGEVYRIENAGSSKGNNIKEFDEEYTISIPANEKYKNPLIFKINDYPSRIKKEFKIKVK